MQVTKITLTRCSLSLLGIGVCLILLLFSPHAFGQEQASAATESNADNAWNSRLKAFYFQDQVISANSQIINLNAPARAEDGARVPISIRSRIPQTKQQYIQNLFLIVDQNPEPLVATFTFTPDSSKADLDLFIRVNAYSPVRVIAQTNDSKLSMSEQFVKASGGCSAPASTDLEQALKRLGVMRFKEDRTISPASTPNADGAIQLMINHPNLSGLQRDPLTTLPIAAHYIKHIEVSFEGEKIFSAETSIALSENPSLNFYFQPDKPGTLTAISTDNKGNTFTHSEFIGKRASLMSH